jgi:hypothetical protein
MVLNTRLSGASCWQMAKIAIANACCEVIAALGEDQIILLSAGGDGLSLKTFTHYADNATASTPQQIRMTRQPSC